MTPAPTPLVQMSAITPNPGAGLRLAQNALRSAQAHLAMIASRLAHAVEIERREQDAVDLAIEAECYATLDTAATLRHQRISAEARRDVATGDRGRLQEAQREAQQQVTSAGAEVAAAIRRVVQGEIRAAYEAYVQAFAELRRRREILLAAYRQEDDLRGALTDAEWHQVSRQLPTAESIGIHLPLLGVSIHDPNAAELLDLKRLDFSAIERIGAAQRQWQQRLTELQTAADGECVPPEAA